MTVFLPVAQTSTLFTTTNEVLIQGERVWPPWFHHGLRSCFRRYQRGEMRQGKLIAGRLICTLRKTSTKFCDQISKYIGTDPARPNFQHEDKLRWMCQLRMLSIYIAIGARNAGRSRS